MPAWEDAANKQGGEFQIRIENLKNMDLLNQKWEELVLAVVSAEFPSSDKLTGIRIVDKSRAGSEQMRIELWVTFPYEDNDEGKAIRQYLETNFVDKMAGSQLKWAKH